LFVILQVYSRIKEEGINGKNKKIIHHNFNIFSPVYYFWFDSSSSMWFYLRQRMNNAIY